MTPREAHAAQLLLQGRGGLVVCGRWAGSTTFRRVARAGALNNCGVVRGAEAFFACARVTRVCRLRGPRGLGCRPCGPDSHAMGGKELALPELLQVLWVMGGEDGGVTSFSRCQAMEAVELLALPVIRAEAEVSAAQRYDRRAMGAEGEGSATLHV